MQVNVPAETTKRKGAVKDDGKKLKKQKLGNEMDAGLTLNVPSKHVEILHLKVLLCINFRINFFYCDTTVIF